MDYGNRQLDGLLSDIASESVTPAGGTAGAVVGAIGTACCEMACIHLEAAGAAVDADLAARREELGAQRARMLTLAEVVDQLFATAGADRSTVKRSVGVPLSLAETCVEALETAAAVTGSADRPVVADAATGSCFLHAALRSALFTVRNNLEYVDDTSFIEDAERRAANLEASADSALEAVLSNVDGGPEPA